MSDFSIGHLEGLGWPWGNAGGVVKTVEDVRRMAQTGGGWIEAGSYTLEKRLGNGYDPETGEPRLDSKTGQPVRLYHHNLDTGETYNSLGMPNKGMDVVETEIPSMVDIASSFNKKLVVNVAPVSNDPATETRELVVRAYEAGADAVLVNAGCRNVVTAGGGRKEVLSFNADALGTALRGLRGVAERYFPVFVRLSPFDDYLQLMPAIKEIEHSKAVSAVFTPNAWEAYRPVDENGEELIQVEGGVVSKSGPAMNEEAERQTLLIWNRLGGSGIDVVSSSSIMKPEQIARRMMYGAVACAGTTFYYEAEEGWTDATDRLLSGFERVVSGDNH